MRGPIWVTLQVVINAFFRVWLGYRAAGYQPIEGEEGALILANHQSFLDPLVVGLPFRRPISFLARDSLFRAPVVGWILKNTHVMPINQQAASTASLRDTIKRLQDGWLVGIFPEGTRSPTGAIGQMKPGFAAIIRRAKHPVYPVGISGAYDALPMGGWFLKPARVRVVFGEPLTVEQLQQYSSRDQDQALVDLVHARIAACHAAAEEWRRTGKRPI
ncbi:lysophospholipid acyltransferase family protein [Schlesneria paludicola]|uniref:lysophospholipid acyltransferase family protein n=1 Tax=Schlesneria paludicola TaxID=360056 RepID=UPI00029A7074|nr:lysophospholipid acyltransferase family protein [Schlesneria paludicola]